MHLEVFISPIETYIPISFGIKHPLILIVFSFPVGGLMGIPFHFQFYCRRSGTKDVHLLYLYLIETLEHFSLS